MIYRLPALLLQRAELALQHWNPFHFTAAHIYSSRLNHDPYGLWKDHISVRLFPAGHPTLKIPTIWFFRPLELIVVWSRGQWILDLFCRLLPPLSPSMCIYTYLYRLKRKYVNLTKKLLLIRPPARLFPLPDCMHIEWIYHTFGIAVFFYSNLLPLW